MTFTFTLADGVVVAIGLAVDVTGRVEMIVDVVVTIVVPPVGAKYVDDAQPVTFGNFTWTHESPLIDATVSSTVPIVFSGT